jgi:hypothetical protein
MTLIFLGWACGWISLTVPEGYLDWAWEFMENKQLKKRNKNCLS